ncbi:GFA family protein [Vibrio splendidus]|uniref:GFA family protein n=1 Tax=Vibrio splendidus TaxID=29497 RepID=UPI000D3BFF16|nr:GFA family protein [Vibrio splendidus]PTQ01389.1 hypothetical protein CWO34_00405 [Vibrio splendidus]
MPLKNIIKGQCSCGQCQFELEGEALFRIICHCNICQQYNQGQYADNTIFKVKKMKLNDPESNIFEYHRLPKMVSRGRCSQCSMPTIEKFTLIPQANIVIIPNANLPKEYLLMQPAAHICCATKQSPINDNIKEINGDLTSQLVFTGLLFKSYFFGPINNH